MRHGGGAVVAAAVSSRPTTDKVTDAAATGSTSEMTVASALKASGTLRGAAGGAEKSTVGSGTMVNSALGLHIHATGARRVREVPVGVTAFENELDLFLRNMQGSSAPPLGIELTFALFFVRWLLALTPPLPFPSSLLPHPVRWPLARSLARTCARVRVARTYSQEKSRQAWRRRAAARCICSNAAQISIHLVCRDHFQVREPDGCELLS